jgi:hypothetical protein
MKMDMNVELLTEPPAEQAGPAHDRRRSRRHAVAIPATLTPFAGVDPIPVEVRDISLHGAGLRCAAEVAAGDEFFLDIGAGTLKLHARVRVANARPRRDGTWDVGASFHLT